jgi:hypothetical protein
MRRLRLVSASFPLTRASILGAIVSVALLSGCKGAPEPAAPFVDSTPPVPQPAPQPTGGSIAGFVIDSAEHCINGARLELIDGPQAGAVIVQGGECDFWGYGDGGYSINDLPLGVPATIRATASGYQSAEVRAVPTNPYSYTTMIVLTKEQ